MSDDLITRLYGERCVDHDDNCCVCVVWDMRDRIEALTAEVERLRHFVEGVVRYAGNGGDDYLGEKARAALGDPQ